MINFTYVYNYIYTHTNLHNVEMPMSKGVPLALNWMLVLRERCCGAARCLEANAQRWVVSNIQLH